MANIAANALLAAFPPQLNKRANARPAGGPSVMDLSQRTYDSRALAEPANDSDVLNLTEELVPLPECSEEFSRVMVNALEQWENLLGGRQLPSAANIDLGNEKLLTPASILFDVSADPLRPEILRIGPQIPLLVELSESAQENELSAEVLREELADFCGKAASSREPFDFDLARRGENSNSTHAMMLPFSNDGESIDHVLCILDLADRQAAAPGAQAASTDLKQDPAVEPDELLLENETDSSADELMLEEEADFIESELLLEQEFEPEEMPNLADPKGREEAAPFLIISVDNRSASLRPTKKFEPDYTFAPLPRAASELVVARPAAGLVDHLVAARELAEAANASQARSRRALYRAIGSAYDFARAAAEAPEDFAEIIAKAGLKMQGRAPMTPVVKLVFGSDYDKGRIAEYATALTHAYRLGLKSGELEDYLLAAPGGLKEIVKTERAWRRSSNGQIEDRSTLPHEKLARQLRALPVQAFSDLAPDGDEFVLVLARRDRQTGVSIVGEIPRDLAMLERAARKLLAEIG